MTISVSKLEDILEKVDSLKVSAEVNKDFEDYDAALNDLDEAIHLLSPTLAELEAMNPEDTKQYFPWRRKFAGQLADCYGMKGGNYRRKREWEEAEAMYTKGSCLEMEYSIPDTYNRTNVIVLQLLRDPKRYKSLSKMIRGTRTVVQDQLEGKNKNKWWAWADFGLLNLLSVSLEATEHQELYRKEAHDAYEKFKNTGAGKQDFESTIKVLKQLKEQFEAVDEATASLMEEEVVWLEKNTPGR
jgi:hypothetical protein